MSRLLDFIHRHEPPAAFRAQIKSGLGAIAGMTFVGGIAAVTSLPLLIAPFGASAVLLFGQPESALAQPANVVGGYLIAALLSAAMLLMLPHAWWAGAIAVGVVIAVMLICRLTHPPAGAVPLVAVSSQMAPSTLFLVVMLGALCLVVIAVLHHSLLPPRIVYPKRRARLE